VTRLVLAAASGLLIPGILAGQSLAPRAYLITPVDSNAVTFTENFNSGGVEFNNTIPITGASGTIHVVLPTYYHALSFFGRSANVTIGLPYSVGTFNALVVDKQQSLYRSGLSDGIVRFSVNLKGGPAMKVPEFSKWKQKRLLGVSLLVQFPSGQYDPATLVNIGANRWAFKPELGYSERWGKWLVDVYSAVWLFTANPEFFSRNRSFPGTRYQTQAPIGVVEGHLSYDVKPRLWASLDGNFWVGGKTRLNGIQNPATLQRDSRIGATASVPISKHQSLKFSYARAAYITFAGNYQALSLGWQYSWIGTHLK